jgi:hypothetical protein
MSPTNVTSLEHTDRGAIELLKNWMDGMDKYNQWIQKFQDELLIQQ